MRMAVIGAGSTALACAAYFQVRGISCRLYARDSGKAELWKHMPLTVSGELETSFYVPVSSSPEDIMRTSDCILIFTGAEDYESVIGEIRPYLRDSHHILFMNGRWGLVRALRLLLQDKNTPEISVGEVSDMPFSAELSADRTHLVFGRKKEAIGYVSLGGEEGFAEVLHALVSRVSRVSSPAATSMASAMPIIRTAGCLFNMTRIENDRNFELFRDGLTGRAADFLEACDRERLEIAKSLGIGAAPLSAELHALLGEKEDSLSDALRRISEGEGKDGPRLLTASFLSEDLHCAMTALCDLADMMHTEAPRLRTLTDMMYLYRGEKREPWLTARDLWILKQWKR